MTADYNARRRELYAENCDKVNTRRREIYAENRERVAARRRELYARNSSGAKDKKAAYRARKAESISSYQKEYRQANKARMAESNRLYMRRRLRTDESFRLRHRLRTRVYLALKGIAKSAATTELLGCSINFLMKHLEEQFKPGMSWRNYGEWHVDHILPCASFDLTDPEQQRKCFHYSNLQPLWSSENLAKRAKVQ